MTGGARFHLFRNTLEVHAQLHLQTIEQPSLIDLEMAVVVRGSSDGTFRVGDAHMEERAGLLQLIKGEVLRAHRNLLRRNLLA